uniref:Transmembrane protein n=1 Tax=Fagus sylvatica TaxID=28930 RepID=A0A2N9EHD1_FAGSY
MGLWLWVCRHGFVVDRWWLCVVCSGFAALTRICGYGLWILSVVDMSCGFCGSGGSMGLTRIVAGGGCRCCVGCWHGFVTFVAGLQWLWVFRHGCVGARIRGLMVAMGFALDVATVGLILGLRV